MAASLSTALDVHFTKQQSDTKRPIFFSFLATLPPQKHHPLQNHHKISQNHPTRKTLLLFVWFSAQQRLEESRTWFEVFNVAIDGGVKLDGRFCGCLLSVASQSDESEDVAKVLACLQQANPKSDALVKLFEDEETSFETLKEEFRAVVSDAAIETRRPFCNCLIDICRKRGLHGRANELLYLGTLHGLYPDLHHKTVKEWSLDVPSLSGGAAPRGVARVVLQELTVLPRTSQFL